MMELILVAIFAMILGGCAHESKVKVVDNFVERDVSIIDIKERVNKNSGLKELQVMGENKTDDYMKLRYRIVWFDKEGFEIESIGSKWAELPVHKNANFTIHVVSPSKNAADYRIFIDR